MTQGRGALTTMRATLSERTNLIQALQRVATQFPENRHRIIRYSTEGDELPLQAGIGEEIVQIASEALRNALQHTTGRIEVRLRYARTRFIVAVDDEGAGMSRAVLESGVPDHFGLRGMRERAARIAASLDIESTPGYGTKIRLVVPGRIAYAAGAGRRGAWNSFKARWSRLHRRA
jgi:signal transduction histidine kinase